jgi:hypothetical protein
MLISRDDNELLDSFQHSTPVAGVLDTRQRLSIDAHLVFSFRFHSLRGVAQHV